MISVESLDDEGGCKPLFFIELIIEELLDLLPHLVAGKNFRTEQRATNEIDKSKYFLQELGLLMIQFIILFK